MSSKILRHPDKEDIISKLNTGESVRAIETYFKNKYPNNKNLWLSTVTLQKFRKENLNLNGKVLNDIKEAREKQNRIIEQQLVEKQLQATNAYQDKISQIATQHLNVADKILQVQSLVDDRIEYWYNVSKSGEELPAKADRELRKYIDQQVLILQQYKKLVEGMADKTVDYNINVTVMNDHIVAIRDAIKEVILELGPEQASLFMEKISKKLNQTSYRPKELSKPIDLKQLSDIEFTLDNIEVRRDTK